MHPEIADIMDMQGFGRNLVIQTFHEEDPVIVRAMILEVLLDMQFSTKDPVLKAGIPWHWFFQRMITTDKARVLDCLCDLEGQGLVVFGECENEVLVLLNPDRYQDAMDKAGYWPEGFEPPEGVEVIRMSPEWADAIEENGLETVAEFLALGFEAPVAGHGEA